MYRNDQNPILYEWITTLNEPELVALGKKWHGISSIYKTIFKLWTKKIQFEIFPIYSPKIEIKYTISCFLPN